MVRPTLDVASASGVAAPVAWDTQRLTRAVARLCRRPCGETPRGVSAGVQWCARRAERWLRALGAAVTRHPLPPRQELDDRGELRARAVGDAVVGVIRPDAARQVLLNIHLDTVYGPDHPFRAVTRPEANVLRGPGVADAKGGLVVMMAALGAFERTPLAERIGWRVVLNPDEEVGSPSSMGLLRESARAADVGLVYEPSLPDGTLIDRRKGSGNFTVVVRGRAAHAGREIERGRNAVLALARLLVAMQDALHRPERGVSLNVARTTGGGPSNVVPDLAVGRFNLRADDDETVAWATAGLRRLVREADAAEGLSVALHGGFTSPPKPRTASSRRLFDLVKETAAERGHTLPLASSGGVCDGNKLAATGLPVIDTLGPRGGALHSDREFILIDSLAERAQLSLDLLCRFAADPDVIPPRGPDLTLTAETSSGGVA